MNLLRRWALIAVAVSLFIFDSPASVLPTTLRDLTKGANLIVVGKVVRVFPVQGVRVAEVEVSTTLKGPHHARLYYLAQGTWTCDTTRAVVGEETLFFFERYTFDPNPQQSIAPVPEVGTIVNLPISSTFKEPAGFREEVNTLVADAPFLTVSWSGRGQMPVRDINGDRYVDVWVGDVTLPKGIPTFKNPNSQVRSVRSAPLDRIAQFVRRHGSRR